MHAYERCKSDERLGQRPMNDVARWRMDIMAAGGATKPMIDQAVKVATSSPVQDCGSTVFTELGDLQRDCMEVMCTWRRDTSLLDSNGLPLPLSRDSGPNAFSELCTRAGCKHG